MFEVSNIFCFKDLKPKDLKIPELAVRPTPRFSTFLQPPNNPKQATLNPLLHYAIGVHFQLLSPQPAAQRTEEGLADHRCQLVGGDEVEDYGGGSLGDLK